MVWTYLAASEESVTPSETTFDPLHTAKLSVMQGESFYPDKPLEILNKLQYGMIYGLSRVICSEEQSISYMEDSHARTSALRDMESAWMASEAAFFGKSIVWPKKSSPSSYSLKTYPQSVPKEAGRSYHRLPKSGMIADGVLYPLHNVGRCIRGKDGGCWLGTPIAQESVNGRSKKFLTPNKLPSPNEFVKMWPTPDSSARGAYKSQEKRTGHHFTIQDAVGSGKLNPVWVEWLMGYRKGWTELSASAMQWFLSARKHRSNT